MKNFWEKYKQNASKSNILYLAIIATRIYLCGSRKVMINAVEYIALRYTKKSNKQNRASLQIELLKVLRFK